MKLSDQPKGVDVQIFHVEGFLNLGFNREVSNPTQTPRLFTYALAPPSPGPESTGHAELTEFGTFAAVHAERLIAFVHLPVQRVENQPVRTQFGRGHAVLALVEFVALHGILVLTVLFGTLELTI